MSRPDAKGQLSRWLDRFALAAAAADRSALLALFAEDCYWRDLLAFTWNLHTAEGREGVGDLIDATLARTRPSTFTVQDEVSETDGVIEGFFTFETSEARCRGYVRLKGDLCWTLLTSMEELKGFEEKKGRRRVMGAQHGVHRDRQTWLERRQEEEASLGSETQPYCLIVGAGQGGLALGARLKRLGVPTLIVEAHDRLGPEFFLL